MPCRTGSVVGGSLRFSSRSPPPVLVLASEWAGRCLLLCTGRSYISVALTASVVGATTGIDCHVHVCPRTTTTATTTTKQQHLLLTCPAT
jgi:hypothetical protein